MLIFNILDLSHNFTQQSYKNFTNPVLRRTVDTSFRTGSVRKAGGARRTAGSTGRAETLPESDGGVKPRAFPEIPSRDERTVQSLFRQRKT